MDLRQVLIALLAVQVSSNEIKTLYTNGYSYSQFFPLKENLDVDKTLRFSVRGSRDAHILLSLSHQADGPVYEIVLGAQNNTFNYIRGRYSCQEAPSASIRTVRLLNRQEYRNFWIRIKSDNGRTFIQVGIGGSDTPFQEWRDPKPLNPQFLSFRSGTTAEWRYGYKDETYTVGFSNDARQSVVTATGYGQYFPLSEIVSHSDHAVTLYFTVRSSKEFQILLSPGLSSLGDVYEFRIGETGTYVSRRHLGNAKAIYQRNGFLDKERPLGFWIKLTNVGEVKLGIAGSEISVLQWLDPDPISPQFVSFSLYRARGDPDTSSYADLQYGLGPDYTLASQDCAPRWKESSNRLSPGAFRGGYNDDVDLFICRAFKYGHYASASVVPGIDGRNQCHVTWNWSVHPTPEFQVLTGCRFSWIAAAYGEISAGAIQSGSVDEKRKIYVARVAHENQILVGRLHPDDHITYVEIRGFEIPFVKYEVLVNRASDL